MYQSEAVHESGRRIRPCRVCANGDGNRRFTAREMMLGTRDVFEYLECGRCGALQILDIPADLSRYYAPPYYSFGAPHRTSPPKRWLKRRVARHVLGRTDPVGALVARLWRRPAEVEWFRAAGLGLDAAILDVGAGSGQLLVALRDYGFRHLLGVDPFIDHDLDHGREVRVLRAGLEDVPGTFDLVMFHHSFEHVADPAATLAAARDRLTPRGRILIRMPVAADSWRVYGPDWVELDPPRHLHVHTPKSLEILVGRTGLVVDAVRHDTGSFELWGSEQYRRDIPLTAPESHAYGGSGTVFSTAQMAAFDERARALNRTGGAGRAAFWLRASTPPTSEGA